ncbi:MAG TPA: hypothetical protein VFG69_09410 [Nannocystaceae bacterium]|nr:hypothetical protein [Nannocystaceae bacterium]
MPAPVDPRTRVSANARRWVYRRSGLGCRRCGDRIAMQRMGKDARSTDGCPGCQRAP